MKNLTILLLASTVIFSCQKENFEPNKEVLQIEKTNSTATTKIDVIYLFFDETKISSGYVNFYSGQNLNYVHEFDINDLKDSLINDKINCKFIKFTRYINNSEIKQNNGMFYVNAYFDENVSVLNNCYVNNKMALNENELFPEPAFASIENNNIIFNSFKVKFKPIVLKPIENLDKF